MKKIMVLSIIIALIGKFSFSQHTFEKTYGGIYLDRGYSVEQTHDEGYVIVGVLSIYDSISYSNIPQLYLMKTNVSGDTLWTRTYEGKPCSAGYSVQQTNDGGYIVVGKTENCLMDSTMTEIYLIKTNPLGDTVWTKSYGYLDHDYPHLGYPQQLGYSVQQTKDDAYIISGSSETLGGTILLKTDINGDVLWIKNYDGNVGYSVLQTNDNGYIIVGYKYDSNADVYLIKTDEYGDTVWTKTFGGQFNDFGYSVEQTNDNGFIIIGGTTSFGAGETDVYLIKTNENGDALWTKTFGGQYNDFGYSVKQTNDNGFIIVGGTTSYDVGETDVYLIKTNENGDTLWTKTFGGQYNDLGHSVNQTNDNGFIIVGCTNSYGAGEEDIYLMKTDENGNIITGIEEATMPYYINTGQVFPNPTNGDMRIANLPDEQLSIELYDFMGRIVKTGSSFRKNTVLWDIRNLTNGIYILKIHDLNNLHIYSEKIIKY